MPNFSGVWDLKDQVQAIAAGRWTGIPLYEIFSAGLNNTGQLGQNDLVARSSPVQVGQATTWAQVSAGSRHSVAITTGGALWAWGFNNTGQLGDGTVINRSSPVQIGTLTNWSQVSAGSIQSGGVSGALGTATLAIKTDGTLWGWGQNTFMNSFIGDGTNILKSSPVQVGALTTWYQVSVGSNFSMAVRTDGTLWTWGYNNFGQLGRGNKIHTSSPVQVGALTTWNQVSAGNGSALAGKNDGTLWAWGYALYGQLGQNNIIARSSPVQVGTLTDWAQFSAGRPVGSASGGGVVAVKTDGTLWAWGIKSFVGDGTDLDRSSPVQIGALTNWARVSAGAYFVMATKTDGTLWGWGYNNQGQLGTSATPTNSPIQIGSLSSWSQASAGGAHHLSIYVDRTN